MNLNRPMLFAGAALALVFSSISAHANLVLNGSFEDASINPGSFTTLNAVNNSITGWTISNGSVDYIGTYWTAADGVRSLDLNGLSPGTIAQQTLNTVNGQDYLVSFALAGNPDNGPTIKTIEVTIGNSGPLIFAFDTTGHTHSSMGWVTENFGFTAIGTSTITFRSLVSNPLNNPQAAYGPALDNVSVTAIPEASTWAMMVLGFASVGFVAYRRKTKPAFRLA